MYFHWTIYQKHYWFYRREGLFVNEAFALGASQTLNDIVEFKMHRQTQVDGDDEKETTVVA